MALIPYSNFNLDKWFDDDWFDFSNWSKHLLPKSSELFIVKSPKVDLYETDKDIVAEIELPGIDPKDINVEVEDNAVVVEAKKEKEKEEKKKGYYHQEISKGYLKRVIPLPVKVKEDKADASYDKGILKVTVPKVEEKKKEEKKVKIKIKPKNNKK